MTSRSLRLSLLAGLGSALAASAQTPADSSMAAQMQAAANTAAASQAATPAVVPNAPVPVSSPTLPLTAVDDEMIDGIKLTDATIDHVLMLLEDWTGRTVLRPQQLPTPTFAINLKRQLPKSEAILALETLLNLNGIGIVPVGDKFMKVVDLPRMRMEAPRLIEGSTLDLPPSGQIASKLFQLEFQRVTEFLPQINMLLNGNIGGYVVFEKSNAALITDSISTLQRIETLVNKLDQPLTSGMTPKFYTLRNGAKASDVVNKINAIVQGPLQSQLGAATRYSADDRTNQIILLSDPRQYPFFDDLIGKLDVKADPNTNNEVIYLKHAAAKDVATLLSNLISNQAKAEQGNSSLHGSNMLRPTQPQPGADPNQPSPAPLIGDLGVATNEFSSLVNIQPDERSNAVVVSGTVDDIRLIQQLVEKVDVLLAQVRIEVVIAEVTLGDTDTTGIDKLGLNISGSRLIGFSVGAGSGAGFDVGGTTTTNQDGSTATSSFATITRPGSAGRKYDLAGIISLSTTPRKNNANLLSVPTIVTTHNKEARIFVGESRPTISSYLPDVGTGGGTNSIGTGYRSTVSSTDIGIELKVKPLIGNDGSVQLDIKQSVNDILGEVIIDGNPQPRIGKRETESFVSVNSGDIIVLGGLQRSTESRSTSRLGPIPIIGDLFGKRSKDKQRTDLVFFLRPYVLTNKAADNEEALSRLEKLPNRDAVHHALDPNSSVVNPNKSKEDTEERPALRRPR